MLKQSLPYHSDARVYYQAIRHLPWSCWLDSGVMGEGQRRFDVLVADPFKTLLFQSGQSTVADRKGNVQVLDNAPLDLLRSLLGDQVSAQEGTPFSGGVVGYFSYEFGVRMEIGGLQADDFPEIALGIYDWAVVVDHAEQLAWLVGQGRDQKTHSGWNDLVDLLEQSISSPGVVASAGFKQQPTANMSREYYGQAFQRIQQYLTDGDCYQVNFAQGFKLPYDGEPWGLYQLMREQNPAPYGAFLEFPFAQILSSSPEQFLGLNNGQAVTRPIKGTRPRSADEAIDQVLSAELKHSPKDQAENLMIVDLLRNDLGRVCKPGSIEAPELFKVESYPTVHHLVSEVTGELRDDEDAISLLQACFPGGSVTGAPKRRAMEIIQELEPEPRGIYCGSIGWIGFDGNMDTNIAIRTLLLKDGIASYKAGGGIVADSDEDAEYQESLDKAAAFFRLVD